MKCRSAALPINKHTRTILQGHLQWYRLNSNQQFRSISVSSLSSSIAPATPETMQAIDTKVERESATDLSDEPTETPVASTTLEPMGVVPNPCSGSFQTPTYLVDDMETTPYMYSPEDEDRFILGLTLRDMANDYGLHCPELGPYLSDWVVDACTLDDGSGSANRLIGRDILTQTRLRVQNPEPGKAGPSTLHIYQYWYCLVNDTSVP